MNRKVKLMLCNQAFIEFNNKLNALLTSPDPLPEEPERVLIQASLDIMDVLHQLTQAAMREQHESQD